jgi:hypothetical protein
MDTVPFPVVVKNHISIQAKAESSSYNFKFLREFICNGKLAGLKNFHI